MIIKKNQGLADVILDHYKLLPVINRFGIKLGFRNITIEELCKDHKIDLDFFLDIVNTFIDEEYFPKDHLKSFSVKLILDYLQQTHNYYLNKQLPRIESKIESLVNDFPSKSNELNLLKQFFEEYRHELLSHIEREEEKVFPYAEQIEEAFVNGLTDVNLNEQMKTYSMQQFLDEHGDIEEKLYDLKNIIIRYLPEIENDDLANEILFDLFRLETDMNNHARIEDKVLGPKVIEMEKRLNLLFP